MQTPDVHADAAKEVSMELLYQMRQLTLQCSITREKLRCHAQPQERQLMLQITPERPMLVFIRLFLKEPDLNEPMGEVPMMLSSSTVCPSTTKRCRMSSVTF